MKLSQQDRASLQQATTTVHLAFVVSLLAAKLAGDQPRAEAIDNIIADNRGFTRKLEAMALTPKNIESLKQAIAETGVASVMFSVVLGIDSDRFESIVAGEADPTEEERASIASWLGLGSDWGTTESA